MTSGTSYEVELLRDGVFRIVEDDGERFLALYLFQGTDRTVLIDTGLLGTPARTLVPALAQIGSTLDQIDCVVVTHADVDHCGGLGVIQQHAPEIDVVFGAADRRMIQDVEVMIDERYRGLREEHQIDESDEFLAWVRANSSRPRLSPDAARTNLKMGSGWFLTILPAPGHTAGHVAVHDQRNGLLAVGDAALGDVCLRSDGSPDFPPVYCDADSYLATIGLFRSLHADTLLTAHYPIMSGSEVEEFWTASEAFWHTLDQSILNELSHGPRSTTALVDLVAPKIRSWPAPADAVLATAAVAHLESLEARGAVARVPSSLPVGWILT